MLPDSPLILGLPLILIVPALVELAKHLGLPNRFAGVAAILCAGTLAWLADLALGTDLAGQAAGYILAGVVYGLAAAGAYSQLQKWREVRDLGP